MLALVQEGVGRPQMPRVRAQFQDADPTTLDGAGIVLQEDETPCAQGPGEGVRLEAVRRGQWGVSPAGSG